MKTRVKAVPLTANNVTKGIINFLLTKGHFAFRVNSTGIYDTKRKVFRTSASNGAADIIACINGDFFAIEVKIGRDKMRASQLKFSEQVIKANGTYAVFGSLVNFESWYEDRIVYPRFLESGL